MIKNGFCFLQKSFFVCLFHIKSTKFLIIYINNVYLCRQNNKLLHLETYEESDSACSVDVAHDGYGPV